MLHRRLLTATSLLPKSRARGGRANNRSEQQLVLFSIASNSTARRQCATSTIKAQTEDSQHSFRIPPAQEPTQGHTQQHQPEELVQPLVASFGRCRYNLRRLVANKDYGWQILIKYPHNQHHGSSSSSNGAVDATKEDPKLRSLSFVLLAPLKDRPTAHAAVFADGSVVSFGFNDSERSKLEEHLSPYEEPLDSVLASLIKSSSSRPGTRNFAVAAAPVATHRLRYATAADLSALGYVTPEGVTTSYIDQGTLNAVVLQSHDPAAKLPFIFALTESIRVEALHAFLAPIGTRVQTWRNHVRKTGSLPHTISEARKLKSQAMRIASRQSKIGARPPLFWDGAHNDQRSMFNFAFDHFEVSERNDALRSEVESVLSTLNYLSDESHKKVDHKLEWVIIILIAVEIIIHLGQHPVTLYEKPKPSWIPAVLLPE